MASDNPFNIYTYRGPESFCDREAELSNLVEMFDNQRFTVLYSMRRLGKTGLIQHFHHMLLKRKNTLTIYCDVHNTLSDEDFTVKLITATVSAIEKSRKGFTRRIGEFFTSLRPVVTFDPVTQMPSLELHVQSKQDVELSLRILMEMLGAMSKKVQIAIDEFQQIANYDETMIDATLRGYLHHAPNVHFLFSGSQRHLLLTLFTDTQRPFFNAVEHLVLEKIDPREYRAFITKQFNRGRQIIEDEAITEILDWTRGHTYHVQYFCNRLYSKRLEQIGLLEVEHLKAEILYTFEAGYLQLQSVLSKNQWKLLKAIAKEKQVTTVSTTAFLSRYRLAQSTAQQSLGTLLDKELLYEHRSREGNFFVVYDPFFSRWLEVLN